MKLSEETRKGKLKYLANSNTSTRILFSSGWQFGPWKTGHNQVYVISNPKLSLYSARRRRYQFQETVPVTWNQDVDLILVPFLPLGAQAVNAVPGHLPGPAANEPRPPAHHLGEPCSICGKEMLFAVKVAIAVLPEKQIKGGNKLW